MSRDSIPGWRGLLRDSPWAASAREAGDAIARDFATSVEARPDLDGVGGIALCLAYHAAELEGGVTDRLADAWLARAGRSAADTPLELGLYTGVCGLGWLLEHVAGGDDVDHGAELDRALEVALAREDLDAPFDLITGLAGIAVYALERLPRPSAVTCLERVVERLAGTALHLDDGVAWRTEPRWIAEPLRDGSGSGCLDAGVAHGVGGVIGVLARIVARGIAVDRARPLLDDAVAWLLARRGTDPSRSLVPSWVTLDGQATPARSAWCYGDPGAGLVLLHAGRVTGTSAWAEAGYQMLRALVRRSLDATRVVCASICHGAFGLAHILARGFAETGDDELRDAARAWYGRGLDMRVPGTGIGGFDGGHRLLGGAPGIGLALVAALSDTEPVWDRLLLCDRG